MADKTGIGWTDATWNPTTGCSRVSEGCKNCYAAALAPRLAAMGQKGYTDLPWTARNAPENVFTHPERLQKPLRWKPRRVFVDSMSDLFHEQVPDEFILRVWQIMRRTPQHTYQILTKRPERMARFARCLSWASPTDAERDAGDGGWRAYLSERGSAPLENVWLGTSVEDQRAAQERIPHLLATPAAVRFLSCEPLIGLVNLTSVAHTCAYSGESMTFNALSQSVDEGLYFESHADGYDEREEAPCCPRVHWVIAGGESGSGHRLMEPEWARRLRDDCAASGVPFYFKQHSAARPESETLLDGETLHQFPDSGAAAATA